MHGVTESKHLCSTCCVQGPVDAVVNKTSTVCPCRSLGGSRAVNWKLQFQRCHEDAEAGQEVAAGAMLQVEKPSEKVIIVWQG